MTQQRMTLSELEWQFHGSSVPSVWERRANVNALCTSSTLKSSSDSTSYSWHEKDVFYVRGFNKVFS